MNAVSGENLTGVFSSVNSMRASLTTSASHSAVSMDEAPFCRTTVTCIWGVSDPGNSARDRDRGVAEGVAHAPDAFVTAGDSRADCDTVDTKRRPLRRRELLQFQGHRLVDLVVPAGSCSATRRRKKLQGPGEHCSRACVPPSLIAAQFWKCCNPGDRNEHLKASADAPNRIASGPCSGANWSSKSSHNGRRQSYGHEQVGWVHIVLAGLVDDSNVPLARSFTVGENLIELSSFQILHPTVFDAQRERLR